MLRLAGTQTDDGAVGKIDFGDDTVRQLLWQQGRVDVRKPSGAARRTGGAEAPQRKVRVGAVRPDGDRNCADNSAMRRIRRRALIHRARRDSPGPPVSQ
ncbi:hypothetical protein GCM10018966_096620 [Streptomyces yanii]